MTQEIKNYFNLKEKEYDPNIKSSEGIGDGVLKKAYTGSESIMFSVLQKPSTYTRSNHQSEKLYPTA
jgi:hypothetical protein